MTRARLALTLGALATGCATASRPPPMQATAAAPSARAWDEAQSGGAAVQPVQQAQPSAQAQPPAPPQPSVDVVAPAPATVGPRPAPARPSLPAPSLPGGGLALPEVDDRGAAIAAAQNRIAAAQTRLAADAATCRDVCGATTTICRSAAELCRLTGDTPSAEARDPRCRNAREVCADASRRRDGACPSCPPER